MQSDQDQATPDDAPNPSDGGRAAGATRWAAARKALGPVGKVDVTFAKIGDRFGIFVSVAESDSPDSRLEIDVTSSLFEGRLNVRREGGFSRWLLVSPDEKDVLIPEAGISMDGHRQALTAIPMSR